jgi:hypothetical protein
VVESKLKAIAARGRPLPFGCRSPRQVADYLSDSATCKSERCLEHQQKARIFFYPL